MGGNCESLKVTNLTDVARIYPFMSPPWYCLFSSRFDVITRCGIQRVIASQFVLVHVSQERRFQSIGTTIELP